MGVGKAGDSDAIGISSAYFKLLELITRTREVQNFLEWNVHLGARAGIKFENPQIGALCDRWKNVHVHSICMSGKFTDQPQIKDLKIWKTWQKGYHSHLGGVAVEIPKLTEWAWCCLRDFFDKGSKYQHAPLQFSEGCVLCKERKEIHVGVFGRSFLQIAATAMSIRGD